MYPEEEKIMQGVLFCPGDPDLRAIKRKTHNLNTDYNATYEDATEKRAQILQEIVGSLGGRGDTGTDLFSLWQTYHHRKTLFCQFSSDNTG